jgi:hypothetical protein
LSGPGIRNVDIGVFRFFHIREKLNLQFRAEMTNALNMVSLGPTNGAPNGTLTSPAFGTVRTARDMRQTQLGLRLSF